MRVFVTGATGFIGSAVVRELRDGGHEVLGLARSERSEAALHAAGAGVLPGTLADANVLTTGASQCDGVVHLAWADDAASFADAARVDRRVIAVLGAALAGTGRPLVVASATSMIAPGRIVTERDTGDLTVPTSRGSAEAEVLALAERGVRVVVVRLATLVHGEADVRGFLPMFVETARRRGVAAYVGDGRNRWPGVHQLDAARLVRLAVESAPAGRRLHAIADEGVAFREIATAVGDGLGVPATSIDAGAVAGHFDLLGEARAALTGDDIPASSALTRELLGWEPTHPDVLADLADGFYVRR